MGAHPEEAFDMWEALGISCGGYNSAIDALVIRVMQDILDNRPVYVTDIATRLGVTPEMVELIQYILCSADLCEYGTSPRGCWFIDTQQAVAFIQKCVESHAAKWKEDDV